MGLIFGKHCSGVYNNKNSAGNCLPLWDLWEGCETECRNNLNWLPIRLRRNTHILTFLHIILFNPHNFLYLKERFEFFRDSHSRLLRSSENLLCFCFYSNSIYFLFILHIFLRFLSFFNNSLKLAFATPSFLIYFILYTIQRLPVRDRRPRGRHLYIIFVLYSS